MNVASLKNCKELYELSGWDENPVDPFGNTIILVDINKIYPRYTLSFLINKLKPDIELFYMKGRSLWRCRVAPKFDVLATSPENAAAKLAIELFKQGVLTKTELGE